MAVQKVTLQVDLEDQRAIDALKTLQAELGKIGQSPMSEQERQKQERHALRMQQEAARTEVIRQRANQAQAKADNEQIRTAQQVNRIQGGQQREQEQIAREAEARKLRQNAEKAQMVSRITSMGLAGVSATTGLITAEGAPGAIGAVSSGLGGITQGLGGMLSKNSPIFGSIVSGLGAAIPVVGQGVASIVSAMFSRFQEVASMEMPMMQMARLGIQPEALQAGAETYGYKPQEAANVINQYIRARGQIGISAREAMRTTRASEVLGINPMAIANFGALGGFGTGVVQSTDQMETFGKAIVSTAEGNKLAGAKIERLLGAISAGIQGIASKGLTVNAESFANFALGLRGLEGARGVQATTSLLGIADTARSQFASSFSGLAETAMLAKASEGAKSPLELMSSLEAMRVNPELAMGALSKLPKSIRSLALMGAGLSKEQAIGLLGRGNAQYTGDFTEGIEEELESGLMVSRKTAMLDEARISRTRAYLKTAEGTKELDSLLEIQKSLELIVEGLGQSGGITAIVDTIKTLINTIKDTL